MADSSARAPNAAEPPEPAAEPAAAESPAMDAAPARLSFTVDATSGAMLAVEALDEGGARRPLTAKEKAALVRRFGRRRLEDILEQTFEAGIASVLGDGDDEDETERDAELRHMIVGPMIARSAARRFLEDAVLAPAVLGALIEHQAAANGHTPKPTAAPRRATPSSHRPAATRRHH